MKRFSVLFAIFLVSVPAFSYELSDVLRQMEEKQRSLDAVQFNFVQKVEFVSAGTASTVKGSALFAKQGKLRVVRNKPDEQIMVSDGKKVSIYNPAFNQVWTGAWNAWVQTSYLPKGLLPMNNYMTELISNFDLSLKSSDGNIVFLEALPHDKSLDYKLELAVATDTWLLNKTTYLSDSAVVETTLSDIKLNPPTSASSFKFDVPKGTDVIGLN